MKPSAPKAGASGQGNAIKIVPPIGRTFQQKGTFFKGPLFLSVIIRVPLQSVWVEFLVFWKGQPGALHLCKKP